MTSVIIYRRGKTNTISCRSKLGTFLKDEWEEHLKYIREYTNLETLGYIDCPSVFRVKVEAYNTFKKPHTYHVGGFNCGEASLLMSIVSEDESCSIIDVESLTKSVRNGMCFDDGMFY